MSSAAAWVGSRGDVTQLTGVSGPFDGSFDMQLSPQRIEALFAPANGGAYAERYSIQANAYGMSPHSH